MRYLLLYAMNFCFIQALFRVPIMRLATFMAHLGEPAHDDYYNPTKYELGSWR